MAETLDIRDLISRFEELESEREGLQAEIDELVESGTTGAELNRAHRAHDEWDEINGEEFMELTVLLTELAGRGGDEQWRGDWYPVTLIAESDFNDYMDEFLEDCGEIPRFQDLPSYIKIVVDYDQLRWDYDEVDFRGTTYLFR